MSGNDFHNHTYQNAYHAERSHSGKWDGMMVKVPQMHASVPPLVPCDAHVIVTCPIYNPWLSVCRMKACSTQKVGAYLWKALAVAIRGMCKL